MTLAVTPEQRAWCDHVRCVAAETLLPLVERGAEGRVNRPLLRALGELGLLPRLFPARALELCLLRESLAAVCTEAETALALQGLGAYPVLQAGADALRERLLPGVARGEIVAAFALSEPGAGSDAAALQTRAERVDGGWSLTGDKCWISNAPEADFYTVFARSSPEPGARAITAFVVPGDAQGVSGEHIALVSPHPIGSLRLDGVFVPDGDVVGEVGGGFRVAMRTLDLFRPSVGAAAVGMAAASLDRAVAHARERQAFGGPLSRLQGVSHALADVATRVEAARLLVHAAATAYDEHGSADTKLSAMAKLFATETAQQAIDAAIQVHGARALQRGHVLEHLYREVRALRIYEGASEVQREIIARQLFR